MVYIQKRISVGMDVLQFFTMREWKFKSDKFEGLIEHQSPEEKVAFDFDSSAPSDEYEYIKNSVIGARVYCTRDPLSTLPKARLQLKM